MKILEDIRYRCACCGEPLMRDGGNRLEPDQVWQTLMCLNGSTLYGPGGQLCLNFGIRAKILLVYREAEAL